MRLAATLSICWALGLLPGSPGSNAAAAQPLVVEAKRVVALQREAEDVSAGRYDWGPSVLKVEGVYYLYYEAPCEYALARGADGKPRVGDEYHNQIFVAVSKDSRIWSHWPDTQNPQPIIAAPESNRRSSRPRYGLGQPSACYFQGRFVLHYVDSGTGPGDLIVRVEADNPFFRNPHRFARSLAENSAQAGMPAGAVARFAQADVKFLAGEWWLARPAYGTGNFVHR